MPIFCTPCVYIVLQSWYTLSKNSDFIQCLQWSSKSVFDWHHNSTVIILICHIAWPSKPTPRIKQHVASYHTTKLIAHRKPKKWLPWQHPLVAGYCQYLHFVSQPLKPPSITNLLLAIVHTKPVIANCVPKLVAMAMSLSTSVNSNTWFLRPIQAHNPNGISVSSAVFGQMTAECPYTSQWVASFPLKIGPSQGGTWTPSNTWFFRAIRVLNPNGISIGSAIFVRLTTVTERQTDRQTGRETMLLGR